MLGCTLYLDGSSGAKASSRLTHPKGASGLSSGPGGPTFILIFLVIPSLLLTATVLFLLYLGIRSFRGRIWARASILIVAALTPFMMFGYRLVEVSIQNDTHAKFVASVVKTGPVASHPDVLIARRFVSDVQAAQLIVGAGLREIVDMRPAQFAEALTYRIKTEDGCVETMKAWYVKGARDYDWPIVRCITTVRWGVATPAEPSSAIVLLLDKSTTTKRHGARIRIFELRMRDNDKDVLVDYWEEALPEVPIFPLLVTPGGFLTKPRPPTGPTLVEFVLRNLRGTCGWPPAGRDTGACPPQ